MTKAAAQRMFDRDNASEVRLRLWAASAEDQDVQAALINMQHALDKTPARHIYVKDRRQILVGALREEIRRRNERKQAT
jgi:hypothetical protein